METSPPTEEPHVRVQQVYGPPGTGKTTYLSKRVRDTAREIGGESVVAVSFTRTAAAELAGRDLPLPKNNIGTLHAFAFRSLDHPDIAEGHLTEWNDAHPAFVLSAGIQRANIDDAYMEFSGATPADLLRQKMEVYRARQIPRDRWDISCTSFANAWDRWCIESGYMDFTALIETALENTSHAPGSPSVGYFDEVQDFTPLELALIRKWGESMDHIALCGDDDQCLYRFKGATPDAFMSGDTEVSKKVLDQSYRIPSAVHEMSQLWVERLTKREPKEYKPRDYEGRLEVASHLTFKSPEPIVERIMAEVELGRSVMLLASCSFMLDPVKHTMRKAGLPFQNKYRRHRGDWNPLASVGAGRVSSSERILAHLAPTELGRGGEGLFWSGEEFKRWAKLVKASEVFARGRKKDIDVLPGMAQLNAQQLSAFFKSEEILADALEGIDDLSWLESVLLGEARKTTEFPIAVFRNFGRAGLVDEPLVTLGTIHSVKGGQADVVFLLPDLSVAGMQEWLMPGEARDSVIRMMYVGMTRAKEELVLCGKASPLGIDPFEMAPHDLLKAS